MNSKPHKFVFIGLIFGIILFYGPTLFNLNIDLGSGYLLDILPNSMVGLLLLGVPYSVGGGTIFLIIRSIFQKQNISESLYFALGMYVAYFSWILLGIIALSNFSGF